MERAEALHELRSFIGQLTEGCREALETLIPELKESEDEKIRKLLIWLVHRNIEDETNDLAQSVYDGIKGHDPDLEESIEDWKKCLAWLEKQKEQKPAEWSEEDEKMLENIRYALGYAFVNNVIDEQTTDYVTTWLNSLRPSWKPSEEQMEALGRCAEYLEESDNEDADILAVLYNQLKKLM